MSHEGDLYDDRHIAFLERLWGEGYLSPGGRDEIARTLAGLDLSGKTVVDIGCGAGGVTVELARSFGAGRVIGLDVEEPVCAAARRRVAKAGLADRVEIRKVEPGPLPLPDASVDMVFSKDSIVHIHDKDFLAREAFRVLRPGGWFAASDWLISHDGEPTPAMKTYLAAEDLDFGMASPDRYRKALAGAGFVDVEMENRNPFFRVAMREDLARLEGPERAEFDKLLSPPEIDRQIRTWKTMIPVLDSGEHCPHLFRARKPG
ncbi:methyltransferase domain-containing protein [Limibaculum sp. M0105]|uniref:Methyltransferase domain-containing protein n=1 Tax=Thermohalobaculum xanthum TaxID=2753746 RepID=A0A8J7SDF3_9RHOB|nr:methyltransferase domain-containing protein [Thermohalobaculum xanthum]MBK0399193.1 methyltransferase domain-containing protein [Thermohalobaculum xanthum]